jgi:putative phage-type endonuclease
MLQQRTDEWRQARCGSVGASDAPRVVRKIRSGGFSADRESLMWEKVVEHVTGVPFAITPSKPMLQGIEREPDARLMYSIIKSVEVEEAGLVPHPTVKGAHASPDGYVGTLGLVEIKCPELKAHGEVLINEVIGNDYMVQMQWQMACTGRHWCDFMSFNPDFPLRMQLWVKRVARDPPFIGELEREITAFVRELEQKVDKLSRRYARAA